MCIRKSSPPISAARWRRNYRGKSSPELRKELEGLKPEEAAVLVLLDKRLSSRNPFADSVRKLGIDPKKPYPKRRAERKGLAGLRLIRRSSEWPIRRPFRRSAALMLPDVFINRIATAVPAHDVHEKFVAYAPSLLADRARAIAVPPHGRARPDRASLFLPAGRRGPGALDGRGFYVRGRFPDTQARMALYKEEALTSGMPGGRAPGAERRGCGDQPSHRRILHRLLCPGSRSATGQPLRPAPIGRAHHRRLHGLLRGHERAQARQTYRALRTGGQGSRGQSRALHPALAGNSRVGAGAVVPHLR